MDDLVSTTKQRHPASLMLMCVQTEQKVNLGYGVQRKESGEQKGQKEFHVSSEIHINTRYKALFRQK